VRQLSDATSHFSRDLSGLRDGWGYRSHSLWLRSSHVFQDQRISGHSEQISYARTLVVGRKWVASVCNICLD
jgi:hypothetical protein